jgi:sporulation protein YlmC with PRC-barrel domain
MHNRFWLALAALVAVVGATGGVWADTSSRTQLSTNEMIFQSTELEGLNVFNRDKNSIKLGHLSDLIIDAHNGRVLYGILNTGVGGSYDIVPWNAFQLQEDNKKSWLTLNKTSDDLKNAPKFDKNNPPDFANADWRNKTDQFFGVQTVARPTESNASGQLTHNEMVFRSSALEKMNVFNRDDNSKKLGSLDDLIIDAHTGTVFYGILDTGIGGKHIPVPWTVLQLQEETKNHKSWLTLNKTSDDLRNAPTFDKKHRPDFTSADWKDSVDRFFGVRTAARPTEEK